MEIIFQMLLGTHSCLNPYYNGRYSWSSIKRVPGWVSLVLILIIMEDTHGGEKASTKRLLTICLNPYYNGRYSWSNTFLFIGLL